MSENIIHESDSTVELSVLTLNMNDIHFMPRHEMAEGYIVFTLCVYGVCSQNQGIHNFVLYGGISKLFGTNIILTPCKNYVALRSLPLILFTLQSSIQDQISSNFRVFCLI